VKCPVCSGAALIQDTRDIAYTFEGETTMLPDLTGQFCDACDESLLAGEELARAMDMMADWRHEIIAKRIDPVFITTVRNKLGLNQKEADDVFGGGIDGFTSYESGTAKPSLPLVQLLRILDRHPELLNELRAA
jgi:HTH-type transcriptional regulator / antitoxin MqsA